MLGLTSEEMKAEPLGPETDLYLTFHHKKKYYEVVISFLISALRIKYSYFLMPARQGPLTKRG